MPRDVQMLEIEKYKADEERYCHTSDVAIFYQQSGFITFLLQTLQK